MVPSCLSTQLQMTALKYSTVVLTWFDAIYDPETNQLVKEASSWPVKSGTSNSAICPKVM